MFSIRNNGPPRTFTSVTFFVVSSPANWYHEQYIVTSHSVSISLHAELPVIECDEQVHSHATRITLAQLASAPDWHPTHQTSVALKDRVHIRPSDVGKIWGVSFVGRSYISNTVFNAECICTNATHTSWLSVPLDMENGACRMYAQLSSFSNQTKTDWRKQNQHPWYKSYLLPQLWK